MKVKALIAWFVLVLSAWGLPIRSPTAVPTIHHSPEPTPAPSISITPAPSIQTSTHPSVAHTAEPSLAPGTFPPLSDAEISVLEEFYNALSTGGPWIWASEDRATWWDFTKKNGSGSYLYNPCQPVEWEGVSCEPSGTANKTSHVVKIVLQVTFNDDENVVLHSYNLNGPLPEALTRFPALRQLRLGGCHDTPGCKGAVSGSLPNFLGEMKTLEVLRVPNNGLVGSIPTAIALMSSLSLLSAGVNSFEGTIPTELGSMTALTDVYLQFNKLQGSIPSELLAAPTIQGLRLDNNALTGTIPDLSQSLTELNLASNSLHGHLPCATLGLLTALDLLDFSRNSLSGSLCSESLRSLQALTVLQLHHNELTGSLPLELYSLGVLYKLGIDSNKFTGSLSDSIAQMVELSEFTFSNNQISSLLPTQVGKMTKLTYFNGENNKLSGNIPEEFTNLVDLTILKLEKNSLSGTLPLSINRMTSLVDVRLGKNSLVGSFPSGLFSLPLLKTLRLEQNCFEGSLPFFLGNSLTELNLDKTCLTGGLSEGLCGLENLEMLTLSENQLTGKIPACLTKIGSLQSFVLRMNNLIGQIPEFALPNLITLDFSHNHFSGSCPPSIADSINLKILMLAYNRLGCSIGNICSNGIPPTTGKTGYSEIPAGIWGLQYLAQLNVVQNFFTGTIPQDQNLPSLTYLALSFNRLSGAVPTSLSMNTLISNILLDSNAFTGTLQASFFSMAQLITLSISDNYLQGTLPDEIGLSTSLEQLIMFDNSFSSSLPSAMSLLTRLQTLSIGMNDFAGTIPESYGFISSLQLFDVQNCDLEGNVPKSFSQLTNLQKLILRENSFTNQEGGWNFIDPLLQKNLKVIDLSSNAFSGTIPSQWLTAGANLEVFSLSANCLEGSLSEDLCSAQSLRALVLDGVTSGETCKALFWGTDADEASSVQFNGSYSLRTLDGSIPSCLFDLPALQTLHLAGNGLEGPIPDRPLPPRLQDLTLSYNRLSQQVPTPLQKSLAQLQVCDLSYNRLSGEFHGEVVVNSNGESTTLLNLEVNAFSGPIPSSFHKAKNISLLDGNLWSCNSERSDLPEYDDYLDQFQCGSNVVNSAMIAFVVLSAVGLLFRLYFHEIVKSHRTKLSIYLEATKHKHSPTDKTDDLEAKKGIAMLSVMRANGEDREASMSKTVASEAREKSLLAILKHHDEVDIAVALNEMNRISSVARYLLNVIILFFLPIYAILSCYFSIIEQKYAWVVTAAYKKDETPAGVLVALWSLFILCTVLLITFQFYQSRFCFMSLDEKRRLRLDKELASAHGGWLGWMLSFRLFVMATMNLIVILAAHFLYVWVLLNGTVEQQNAATWGLSAFKSAWEAVWFGWVLKSFRFGSSAELLNEFNAVYGGGHLFLTMLKMFNNIVAPCLVTALIDSTCFKNTIIAPPPIVTHYAYNMTTTYNFTVEGMVKSGFNIVLSKEQTEFLPPYAYTFKCGSILIQQFTPVFIIDAIQECCFSLLIELGKYQFLSMPASALSFNDYFQSCVADVMLLCTFGILSPFVAITKWTAMTVRTLLAQKQVLDYLEFNEDVKDLSDEAEKVDTAPLYQARYVFIALPGAFLAFFATDMAGYHSQLAQSYVWAPVVMTILPAIFVLGVYLVAIRFFPQIIEERNLYDSYAQQKRQKRDDPNASSSSKSAIDDCDSSNTDSTAVEMTINPVIVDPNLAKLVPTNVLKRTSLVTQQQFPQSSAVPRLSLEGPGSGKGSSIPWIPGLPSSFAMEESSKSRRSISGIATER